MAAVLQVRNVPSSNTPGCFVASLQPLWQGQGHCYKPGAQTPQKLGARTSTEQYNISQHCPGTGRSGVSFPQHLHSPKHWVSHPYPAYLLRCLRTTKTWILANRCLLQHWRMMSHCVTGSPILCHLCPPPSWGNPVYHCPIPVCQAGNWAADRLQMSNHISYSTREKLWKNQSQSLRIRTWNFTGTVEGNCCLLLLFMTWFSPREKVILRWILGELIQ